MKVSGETNFKGDVSSKLGAFFFWNSDKNMLGDSETSLIHGRYKKNRIVSHFEGIFLGESDGSISPNSKVEMRVSAAYLLFRRIGI